MAILVTAVKATALPSDGSASTKARKTASQTVRMGACVLLSTWSNHRFGMPESRAKAYIMRLLDVTLNVPQSATHKTMKPRAMAAPVLPNASRKMCRTGCDDSSVAW